MASTSRRTSPGVIAQLAEQPGRFDFFQGVRLLDSLSHDPSTDAAARHAVSVGYDGPPHRETVRFRVLQSHAFPAGAVCRLELPKGKDGLPEMTVAFLGLTGPSGVLPHHYTTLIIDRGRSRDYALRDFLDLFNHRTISLFYRAWEKYRFPFAYERTKGIEGPAKDDPFTQALFSLVGFGTPHLRNRMEVHDEAFLLYAGHFAHFPRNALSLETLVADYFALPTRVQQFQGQWLRLAPEEQSQLPTSDRPNGRHCGMGVDLIAGERVWSVEGKFRICLGPLRYDQFRRFMPDGHALQQLGQLVRTYIGWELDFDAQLVLCAQDVPPCLLGGSPETGPRLGWNIWLNSGSAAADADEAVFVHDGLPSRPVADP